MKRALTLVEILVILVIIGILIVLIFSRTGWSFQSDEFTAEVIRKYEVTRKGDTQRLIDIKKLGQSQIDTVSNDDLFGKYNSGTIHANLIEHHFYIIKTVGVRNEILSSYPNIVEIREVFPKVERPN